MVERTGELKTKRILHLYDRLMNGDYIRKQDVADEFNVSEKAIQRDFEVIREYLYDTYVGEEVSIDYEKGVGHSLNVPNSNRFSREEVILISKILLESRAFLKEEMNYLLNKVIAQCKVEEQKHTYEVIRNEVFLYQPVTHNKPLAHLIGELSNAIVEQNLVTIEYMRIGALEPIQRIIEPLGIMFSEFYFYLVANIHGAEKEYPAIYRLDRIEGYTIESKHFRKKEQSRFQEGEFRKQVQFMQTGKLMHVKFRYWGASIEAVKDRLPNAEVKKQSDDSYLVEAKVFGQGVKMWLLSQAEFVEVLTPQEFRLEMMSSIKRMAEIYNIL
ncbi:helix-turn-helix transcriptional regulator [Paenibacillus ihbetae]|uniref:WYL domain-containing protein n=1 Tax=Paenibacillus ihbetae TaxID=1870820 RepID=A0ABX3JSN6_9BACL|nr:WYL domain-containing protein [Paenibacillus ihbetae]OOC58747.1 hypothetical protein BBD40_24020 [Paenibacillus ihbetae]